MAANHDVALPPNDGSAAWLESAAASFEHNGVVSLESGAVSDATLQRCRASAASDEAELLAALADRRAAVSDQHEAARCARVDFAEMVHRDGGRVDVRLRCASPPLSDLALVRNAAWFPLCRKLLGGGDVNLLYSGYMIAKPTTAEGEAHQRWHQDGEHCFEHAHCPPHAVNVFVPLCDVSAANGGTQFRLGSNVLGRGAKAMRADHDAAVHCPAVRAGGAVLFDYRTVHRGAANRTLVDRVVMYFCFSRSWFADTRNTRSRARLVGSAAPWVPRRFPREGAAEGDNGGGDDTDHAAPAVAERWVLFELNVELGDGKSGALRVHHGDDPVDAATAFLVRHGLPTDDGIVGPLADAVRQQIELASSAAGAPPSKVAKTGAPT